MFGIRVKIKEIQCALISTLNFNEIIPFATGSIDVVIDNSANVHVCNTKLFLQSYKPLNVKYGIETAGDQAAPQIIGHMCLVWIDDDGNE